MKEDVRALRRLADWYRGFSEVGGAEDRKPRLKLAIYLDRKADELEKRGDGDLTLVDYENLFAGFRGSG